MKASLGWKRGIAGVWLLWLLFCAANYYFDLNLVGRYAKPTLLLSLLVSTLAIHRYGPKMQRQLKAHKRLKRMRENGGTSNMSPISPAPPNNRWRGP
jgi:hypothetical protein